MSLRGALRALKAALVALTPGLGDTKAAERVDEVFSWETVGAIFLGGAAGKVFEKTIAIHLGPSPAAQRWGYLVAFLVALVVFAWWHEIRETAEDLHEEVDEAVDGGGD